MIMEIKRSFASVALEVNFPGLQEILISQAHPLAVQKYCGKPLYALHWQEN